MIQLILAASALGKAIWSGMDFSKFNLKTHYLELLGWLNGHPDLSYWFVFFIVSFTFLLFFYLVITNLRLHFHIRSLNRDKQRLMEEKDLMRKGRENQ